MRSTESSDPPRPAGTSAPGKRRYRKKERARQEAETQLRITEAVIGLHRTVGPARTTVKEVAERAGVSRMTVYNHFPTEADLIEACSTHWASQNPLPDPERWRGVADPDRRLRAALGELYGWYRDTEDMMGKVLRDAPIVAPLGELVEARWFGTVARMVEVLAAGRPDAAAPELRAALRLAVDFATWRTLTGSGLGDGAAADLAAGIVARVPAPARARS